MTMTMEFSASYYILPLLAVIIALSFAYIKLAFRYWKNRNVPYLEPSFPFGNFENPLTSKKAQPVHLKNFYDKFKKMGHKYGGIYSFLTPAILPIDPELNKHILVKSFQSFHSRDIYVDTTRPYSTNLFNIDGEKWRTLRTKLTPTFTSAKIKQMFNFMSTCSVALNDYIKPYAEKKIPIDIKDTIGRLTTEVIAYCAFGIECNSFKDQTYQHLLMRIFSESFKFSRLIFILGFPALAKLIRFPVFPVKPTKAVIEPIKEMVKMRKETKNIRNDFLQSLIEMEENGKITMDEIQGQSLLFFLGGYETSATTMTFTLFELACNQEIQEKLRNEIYSMRPKYGNLITYEAIQEMKYLEMVVDETLRKYPPMAFLLRKSVEDFTLPNTNIKIEKGTSIIVPILGFHRDPEYFPNPKKYDPDRFSEENKKHIVPYSYIPFGEGPRNCIGERFAKLQVKVGLASLINKYKFKLNSQVKLPLEFTADTVPTPKHPILLDVEFVTTS